MIFGGNDTTKIGNVSVTSYGGSGKGAFGGTTTRNVGSAPAVSNDAKKDNDSKFALAPFAWVGQSLPTQISRHPSGILNQRGLGVGVLLDGWGVRLSYASSAYKLGDSTVSQESKQDIHLDTWTVGMGRRYRLGKNLNVFQHVSGGVDSDGKYVWEDSASMAASFWGCVLSANFAWRFYMAQSGLPSNDVVVGLALGSRFGEVNSAEKEHDSVFDTSLRLLMTFWRHYNHYLAWKSVYEPIDKISKAPQLGGMNKGSAPDAKTREIYNLLVLSTLFSANPLYEIVKDMQYTDVGGQLAVLGIYALLPLFDASKGWESSTFNGVLNVLGGGGQITANYLRARSSLGKDGAEVFGWSVQTAMLMGAYLLGSFYHNDSLKQAALLAGISSARTGDSRFLYMSNGTVVFQRLVLPWLLFVGGAQLEMLSLWDGGGMPRYFAGIGTQVRIGEFFELWGTLDVSRDATGREGLFAMVGANLPISVGTITFLPGIASNVPLGASLANWEFSATVGIRKR